MNIERILVINVNWLGDVIFSTPVFRALRKAYPRAKISCLAVPRVQEVLECVPEIDELIVFDEKGKHWNPFGKIGLILELRKRKFDIAFILHGAKTRALLAYFAGIPERIGYDTKNRAHLLTRAIADSKENIHRSDYYLKVIESYGVKVEDRTAHLRVDEVALKEAGLMLEKNGIARNDPFIVINPGGNWPLKQWAKEQFSSLLDQLLQDKNIKVVMSGAKTDIPLAEKICERSVLKPVVLTGKTDLKQLMALMKRARCVISADSGPLHLANSVGTEVIALFGPTRPEITGPRGKGKYTILQHDVGCNRKACYYLQCPDNICMQSISVKEVLDAVK